MTRAGKGNTCTVIWNQEKLQARDSAAYRLLHRSTVIVFASPSKSVARFVSRNAYRTGARSWYRGNHQEKKKLPARQGGDSALEDLQEPTFPIQLPFRA